MGGLTSRQIDCAVEWWARDLERPTTHLADGRERDEVVAAYPEWATRLPLPLWAEGWDWAGVDRLQVEALARQAARSVKRLAAGDTLGPARKLGGGAIAGIVVAVLLLVPVLALLLSVILESFC
jgi:hypothetical protein